MPARELPDWKLCPELSRLLDLPKPPKQLFYLGTWDPAIFNSCTAVVGTRRMTAYGRQVVEMIVPQLAASGKTIISGFMYGIDQYAHKTAIDAGAKTVAVLGWGINYPLNDDDQKLALEIVAKGGLLLSEWADQKPTLWTFPVRNRIVAALSSDVILVEAAEKSGSLITANIARKLRRRLWAVPGPINSRVSKLPNTLIAEGSAVMWFGAPVQEKMDFRSDDPLVEALADEPLSVNDLARKLGAAVEEVGARLSVLTLTGQLAEREGRYYVRQN